MKKFRIEGCLLKYEDNVHEPHSSNTASKAPSPLHNSLT